jgi:hypothetical protein
MNITVYLRVYCKFKFNIRFTECGYLQKFLKAILAGKSVKFKREVRGDEPPLYTHALMSAIPLSFS